MLSKSLRGHMTFKLRLQLPNLLLFRSANFLFGHFPRRHWSCWEAQELFLSLFFRFLLPIYFSRWVDFSQDCCERWCWYELHFFAAPDLETGWKILKFESTLGGKFKKSNLEERKQSKMGVRWDVGEKNGNFAAHLKICFFLLSWNCHKYIKPQIYQYYKNFL